MKLLAIETATEMCSAALVLDNDSYQQNQFAPRHHTELILTMIDSLLKQTDTRLNQLDAIAFSSGPGAFTGVRICFSVAQGLAAGSDIPVIPVSTLASLAQTFASKHEFIVPAIDARMKQIYWGLYQVCDQTVKAIHEEQVSDPDQLVLPHQQDWIGVGNGWTYAQEYPSMRCKQLRQIYQDAFPDANAVATLAQSMWQKDQCYDAQDVLPRYIRNNIVRV